MIDLVIEARRKDLGGFEVGRVLPVAARRMVGPFVFFDHMGPVDMPAGIPRSVDVRPHPHIGLSTVTYLFEGEIMHRDSLASAQAIRPGEVNWMTAGKGITHSERFERARMQGDHMHGIQAWVALPKELEETDPAFAHHDHADLPTYEGGGMWARLVAGGGVRCACQREDAFPDVLRPLEIECRRQGATAGRISRTRRVCRARHRRSRRKRIQWRSDARVCAGSAGSIRSADRRCRDVVGRRTCGRALHRMEFRIVIQRAYRTSQSRLACRPHETAGCRQSGIHSAAGRSASACESDVVRRRPEGTQSAQKKNGSTKEDDLDRISKMNRIV